MASLVKLSREKCIYRYIRLFHGGCPRGILKLDDIVCLGSQFDDGVVYICLTTVSLLCNVFRAVNGGWRITWMGDAIWTVMDDGVKILRAKGQLLSRRIDGGHQRQNNAEDVFWQP